MMLAVSACQTDNNGPQLFTADNYPPLLSQWQLMQVQDSETLRLHDSLLPYDLATPLFSDYALKLRTVWMPPDTSARYHNKEVFDFPVGTIISKTFYYPRARNVSDIESDSSSGSESGGHSNAVLGGGTDMFAFADNSLDLRAVRLMETRLLVRQADGWDALPYVWDAQQQDATLQVTGAIQRLTLQKEDSSVDFAYIVPNQNECSACHVTDQNAGYMQPIGPAARHLDKEFQHYPQGPAPQLQQWADLGKLKNVPEFRQASDATAAGTEQIAAEMAQTENLARAYLDINCGHCHQPGGSADTSGLFLHATETSLLQLGVCKPPVAAGRGTGGKRYSVVPGKPEESILLFRMESQELDILMPELGRTLVHEEGVVLLRNWINQLRGQCTD